MNVTDTVTWSLKNYPGLYRNRMDVLNHLFCTLGGGYEWEDGELVNLFPKATSAAKYTTDYDKNLKAIQADAGDISLKHKFVKEHMEEYHKQEAKTNQLLAQRIEDELPELATRSHPLVMGVYPMVEKYANLIHFPENVKADWLEAARETALAIVDFYSKPIGAAEEARIKEDSVGHYLKRNHLLDIAHKNYAKDGPENLRIAKKALAKIKAVSS